MINKRSTHYLAFFFLVLHPEPPVRQNSRVLSVPFSTKIIPYRIKSIDHVPVVFKKLKKFNC